MDLVLYWGRSKASAECVWKSKGEGRRRWSCWITSGLMTEDDVDRHACMTGR